MILEDIIYRSKKEKLFSLLIDPEKYNGRSLERTVKTAAENGVDYIFVGGSLVSDKIDNSVETIKNNCAIPVVLFPGSYLQISDKADGILFISLISGRNPEYLIGNHVITAPLLKKSNLEIIPTGYILISGKRITSVEYMSNTTPIPPEKVDIIIATAQAGEMLGLKMVYLEAGSGAEEPLNEKLISQVRENISLPLLVGGGLKKEQDIINALNGGADMVIVGNSAENDLTRLKNLCSRVKNFKI